MRNNNVRSLWLRNRVCTCSRRLRQEYELEGGMPEQQRPNPACSQGATTSIGLPSAQPMQRIYIARVTVENGGPLQQNQHTEPTPASCLRSISRRQSSRAECLQTRRRSLHAKAHCLHSCPPGLSIVLSRPRNCPHVKLYIRIKKPSFLASVKRTKNKARTKTPKA